MEEGIIPPAEVIPPEPSTANGRPFQRTSTSARWRPAAASTGGKPTTWTDPTATLAKKIRRPPGGTCKPAANSSTRSAAITLRSGSTLPVRSAATFRQKITEARSSSDWTLRSGSSSRSRFRPGTVRPAVERHSYCWVISVSTQSYCPLRSRRRTVCNWPPRSFRPARRSWDSSLRSIPACPPS